jgi:DNA modification methylase
VTCTRKIGPYDCCSVVEGDCLELMKALPDGCVDAVITDPPYGIFKPTGSGGLMFGRPTIYSQDVTAPAWDVRPDDNLLFRLTAIAPRWVIWGGNYFADVLGACKSPLIWNKETGNNPYADGELAWSNVAGTTRIFTHQWCGAFKDSERGQRALHPTQKPVALMMWCIEQANNPETILDPYAGSGTTLVAAAKLGRHFLGFEISPEYCEIARNRIALVEAQPNLFTPRPEQLTISDALRSHQGETK